MKIKSSFTSIYKLPTIFLFFMLVLINISTIFADNVVPELNEPVWDDYKSQSPAEPRERQKDYEKPIATIVPSAKSVTQGESIYFRLEYENAGSSYYWLMGDQRGSARMLKVDTSGLKPGKHRVRVSVTNKAREQAHSQVFFEVLAKPNSSSSAASERVPVKPVDYQETNSSDITSQFEMDDSEKTSPSLLEESDVKNTNITIEPSIISLNQGKSASFKANVALSDDYEFRWRFGTQLSDLDNFQISTNDVIPGTYNVYLSVTDKDGNDSDVTAQLIVRDPEIGKVKIPNLVGKEAANIDDILKTFNLIKGKTDEKEVTESQGKIISQFPNAGIEVNLNSKIYLVIGVGVDIEIPDLIGKDIEDTKIILDKKYLRMTVEKKTVDNEDEDGKVLSQQPIAGKTLKQGDAVTLVVGEKKIVENSVINDPINVTITATTLSVEQGEEVVLNADIKNAVEEGNYTYVWTFGEQKGNKDQFKIKTDELALGKHTIQLQVKKEEQKGESEVSLHIRAKRFLVPLLTNLRLDEAQKIIKKKGLLLGSIKKQHGNVEEAIIKQQSPAFGKYIRRDQPIDLVLTIPEQDKNDSVRVDINFDKTIGEAGEPIVFTTKVITKADLNDIHYVYSINNIKKASVEERFTWVPEVEGTYTISVTVYNDRGAIAKSEPYILTIDEGWEAPVAKVLPKKIEVKQGDNVEFISNSTYDLNSSLIYEWISDSGHSGNKKIFSIDTSSIDAGEYDVTLTITDDKGKQSTTTANLTVQEVIVAVKKLDPIIQFSADQKAESKDKDNPQVILETSQRIVQIGQTVQFSMQVTPKSTDILYYYQLGDRKRRQWMKVSNFEHQYDGIGSYAVRAVIKQNGQVYYSDPVTIWVWSSWLLGLVGGVGLFLFILIGWWTKRNIGDEIMPLTKPLYEGVAEEQITLPQADDKYHIVTEKREQDTVKSVLIKGIFQFILGILLSFIILYIILKLMGLT